MLTALHRDPARRYPSAAALADDLGRFLAGRPIGARADTRRYRLRKFVGRNRLPVTVAALGLAALLGGLGLALWQAHAARLAARRADAEAARAERVKSFLLSVFRQSDPERADGGAVSARELLEGGAQRIDAELAGDPVTQADVFDAVARIENNLGLIDPALAHASRALALREKVLPRGDARIADEPRPPRRHAARHGDIGPGPADAGEGAGGDPRGPWRRQPRDGRGPALLADTLRRPEDRARAVALLRQALATFRRRLGDGNVETAETLPELGAKLEESQQYAEAEQAYRQALARLERALGPRHPRVAMAQADLAGLLDRLSRPAEARKLLETAIATQRAILGPHHLDLAQTLFSYGLLLIGQQELAAADSGAATRPWRSSGRTATRPATACATWGSRRWTRSAIRRPPELFTRAAGDVRPHAGGERLRTLAGDRQPRLGAPEARAGAAGAAGAHPRGGADREAHRPGELRAAPAAQGAGGDADARRAPPPRRSRSSSACAGWRRSSSAPASIAEVAGSDLLLAQARLARGAAGDRRRRAARWTRPWGSSPAWLPRRCSTARSCSRAAGSPSPTATGPRARRELAAAEPILLAHVPPAPREDPRAAPAAGGGRLGRIHKNFSLSFSSSSYYHSCYYRTFDLYSAVPPSSSHMGSAALPPNPPSPTVAGAPRRRSRPPRLRDGL